MVLSVKNAGAWDSTVKPYAKSAGTWSKARPLWVRNGGIWVPVTNAPLKSVLSQLGLLASTHVVVDIGDVNSFAFGGTQTITDLSGQGSTFVLGTTTGAEASDPTPSGAADGLSASEYLSLDGGDMMKYTPALAAWINTLHKDGAVFSWAGWYSLGAVNALQALWGTGPTQTSAPAGVMVQVNQSGQVGFLSQRSGGTGALIVDSTLVATANTWSFFGGSINENGGAGASFLQLNGSVYTFNGAYATPSTTATTSLSLCSSGGGTAAGNYLLKAGSKFAMLAIFGGTAISQANMLSIFNNTRDRFGV